MSFTGEYPMPIHTLERLLEQRQEQVDFIDHLLSATDSDDGRDLVPAERANLDAARQRITELDEQIEPLADYDRMRNAHADVAGRIFGGRGDSGGQVRPLGQNAASGFSYASAGAFIVDSMRARGIGPWKGAPDPAAATRLQSAVVDKQITSDTPGLLPKPIIGPVVNTLDAARPFITSIGAKSMGGVPGASFSRSKITQHALAGKQTAEKTELPSRKMIISPVDFAKGTFGGVVNISRQDIDWTSPSAWDALTQDLADVYGLECENAAADDFAAKVLQTVAAPGAELGDWAAALYAAAAKCYRGGAAAGAHANGRLPDRLWVSLDMWALMGAVVDVARLQMRGGAGNLGDSELSSFSGDVLNLPRIVVPEFADGTIIVGNSTFYEFWEEVVGLISAVEPAILGVEVAYGGYAAYGMLEANCFCKVTAPVAPPLTAKATATKSNGTTTA
jgi:hypothetical protein